MKYKLSILLAAVFAISVGAADFRIDISGVKGLTLAPVSASEGVSLQQASWRGKSKDQTLSCTVKLENEWKEYSFSFMPKKSGQYNISLMSTDPEFFAACDSITVSGTTLRNGDFEQVNAKGNPSFWYTVKNPRFSKSGGVDGSKYVVTAHNDRWTQQMSCKRGEKVTITFYARTEK